MSRTSGSWFCCDACGFEEFVPEAYLHAPGWTPRTWSLIKHGSGTPDGTICSVECIRTWVESQAEASR